MRNLHAFGVQLMFVKYITKLRLLALLTSSLVYVMGISNHQKFRNRYTKLPAQGTVPFLIYAILYFDF